MSDIPETEQPSWYVYAYIPAGRYPNVYLEILTLNTKFIERYRRYFDNKHESFVYAEKLSDIDRLILIEQLNTNEDIEKVYILKWGDTKWLEFSYTEWADFKLSHEFYEEMVGINKQFGFNHFHNYFDTQLELGLLYGLEYKLGLD